MVEAEAGVGVPAVGEERSQWAIAPFGAARDQDRVHGVRSCSRIPARARAAVLAPQMRRYQAPRLRLDVRTHGFVGHVAVQRRAHSGPCGHNRGRPLSRVPCAWTTRRTWMGVRAE